MWEEFNQKQNDDEMLMIQFYARKMFNFSNILFTVRMVVIIVIAIFSIINFNGLLVALISLFCAFLSWLEEKCIKNAANAREVYDTQLFGFDNPDYAEKIIKSAKKFCNKNYNEFEIQKNNTGEEQPAGVKNWYTKSDGRTKNEIIFDCQIENTKWDEKITKINSLIFLGVIAILFCIYIIIKLKDSVLDFIIGIILASEMLVWLIQIWIEYKKYNENLQKRKNQIEKIKMKKPKKEDLISLQKLIEERRNLKLVPFNSIHKYIKNEMHELIKNNRS